jgi:hypothetical protein
LYDRRPAMPLTVRLSEPLERALEAYCAEHGLTRTEVVQESLTEHLGRAARATGDGLAGRSVSRSYAAFKRAGLVGALRLGSESATKDVVRARIASRLKTGS